MYKLNLPNCSFVAKVINADCKVSHLPCQLNKSLQTNIYHENDELNFDGFLGFEAMYLFSEGLQLCLS